MTGAAPRLERPPERPLPPPPGRPLGRIGWAAAILRLPILAYRLLLSPLLGPRCRFHPSCSVYALEALAAHGALRGSWLTLRRLARCQPWGGSGYDPVPPVAPAAAGPAGPSPHTHAGRPCPH